MQLAGLVTCMTPLHSLRLAVLLLLVLLQGCTGLFGPPEGERIFRGVARIDI